MNNVYLTPFEENDVPAVFAHYHLNGTLLVFKHLEQEIVLRGGLVSTRFRWLSFQWKYFRNIEKILEKIWRNTFEGSIGSGLVSPVFADHHFNGASSRLPDLLALKALISQRTSSPTLPCLDCNSDKDKNKNTTTMKYRNTNIQIQIQIQSPH